MSRMRILKSFLTVVALLAIVSGARAQQREDLKPGDPSPDFKYEDMNGKIRSLSEYRGKYVLIDCWASWCAPCRAQAPHMKKIMRKFRKKNIVFVMLSQDYSREDWLRAIKEEQLGGVHLIVDRKDISFYVKYRIEQIPRYILIDKEGKIVNADLPLPSDPEMAKILKRLEGI